jgi:6-phosphogluconolactonase
MVRRTLTDRVGATLLPVPYEGESPESASAAYAEQLVSVLSQREGKPSPDVVLLGIGDDGHTLSLFPGTAALDEQEKIYTANWVPKLDTWRVTATYGLVDAAQHVLFLVSGAGKADTVARILEDPTAGDPAARITSSMGEVVWLLDTEAASRLGGDR